MTIEIILRNEIINIDDSLSFDFSQAIYPRGLNGYTPQKGIDYWTVSDKTDIVSDVLNSQEIHQINKGLHDLSYAVEGKYEKPSGGIPASDLASGVIPDVTGKADKVQNATSGNFASLDANGNVGDSGHKHSDYLTEHQDLTDYVKNTDWASANDGGIVKVNNGYGIAIGANDRILKTQKPSSTQVKNGANSYTPLVPEIQHESAFYGLAKAAGDTTQSASSNAVGTYTSEALKAIRKMLGIPNMEWEKIADVTLPEDSTEINIQTDLNGLGFKLRKLVGLFSADPSTTGGRDTFYTQVYCHQLDINAQNITSAPSLTYTSATSSMRARMEIEVAPNEPIKMLTVVAGTEGSTQNAVMMPKNRTLYKYIEGFRVYQSEPTKSLIPSGSRLLIFGIRYDD